MQTGRLLANFDAGNGRIDWISASAGISTSLDSGFGFESNRPVCKICSDTMVAAEASALSEMEVSYLWSCDTCGYGFVTKHAIKPFVCN